MAGASSVQTVGNFTLTFQHPLIAGNTPISLRGIKLDEAFAETQQLIDNAKRIALVDGGSAALTNAQTAGDLTIHAIRISNKVEDGDIVLIASTLQGIGDSTGATIRASYGMNGVTEAITFTQAVLKSCPPLKLSGNDLPSYPVVFSYAGFIRG